MTPGRPRAGALGYSGLMFDVLVYLYENYWRPDACPEPRLLSRKLSAVGFESEGLRWRGLWHSGSATLSRSLTSMISSY